MRAKLLALSILSATVSAGALADSTAARCDIYPKGEDKASAMLPCTFSQRQGAVTIIRDDGVTHDLRPVGDSPGNYEDADGNAVYRQSGLGDQGLIFRLPKESIFVYWSTEGLNPEADEDNPTAPFSTADFDATTLLRCKPMDAAEFGTCPAGIARMEGGQASITVKSPAGEQFTFNFMTDYVNAANREVKADLEGDTWKVVVDGKDLYEVPIAAIEGG